MPNKIIPIISRELFGKNSPIPARVFLIPNFISRA